MRRFIYLVTAILCYITLCSKSCNEGNQNGEIPLAEKLSNEKTEIRNEFVSEFIPERSLSAFESKAKQKLTDLSDYLNILSDSSMDGSFREQSKMMVVNLFISDTIGVNRRLLSEKEDRSFPINKLIRSEAFPVSKKIVLDSIRISEQLHFTTKNTYKGRLAFSRRIQNAPSKDSIWSPCAPMQVEFFLSKIKKSFGSDTLQVWNLSLGTIF